MKFTTTLTLTALILTSTLGVFQKVNAQDAQKNDSVREQIENVNAQDAQKNDSVRRQIENVNQPQGCAFWPKC